MTSLQVALLLLALRHDHRRWAAALWQQLALSDAAAVPLAGWLETLADPLVALVEQLAAQLHTTPATLADLALRPATADELDIDMLAAALNLNGTVLRQLSAG